MQREAEYEMERRTLVIRVNGDLDHHNAERIRETADRLIDANGIRRVVFDFSQSGFMDSSGIGVVMGRCKKMRYVGGKVSVAGAGKRIRQIFQMSGLGQVVELCEEPADIGCGSR